MPGRKGFSFVVFLILLLCIATAPFTAGRTERTEACSLSITSPSDANGPVIPGHSFFITGTITTDQALPEGTKLRVSVLDETGREVRFAESAEKDRDVVDRFCDAFFYYADDADPERSGIHAREFPCLIVTDPEDPDASLRNAGIKCWFSDDGFNAFIPYATDAAHGLLMDDGIGYTDPDGKPYDALPDGSYTAAAVLKDSEDREIASVSKAFFIAPATDAILCRFHPDEQYENMMRFAAENSLSMNIDYLPGYYKDPNGNDRGGLRAMFIGGDAALYNGSHVHMVEYLAGPDSSSLVVELPYIESRFNIDDPERFTVYRYDIGEPVIRVRGQETNGKLVTVESGDRLCLCRADMVRNATEGYLDFNTAGIMATDTDFSDGVNLQPEEDCLLAIAGLAVPYQLKEEEILFDPANNRTGLLNRVEYVIYSVWDGLRTKEYRKPVELTRRFADGSEYDSVMEFYHVFSREEIDPEGAYTVTLYGIDRNGEPVEGTEETFSVRGSPAPRMEGEVSAEEINKYGNVPAGFSYEEFRAAGFDEGDIVTVRTGGRTIDMPFCTDYRDVRRGEPLLVSDNGRMALWVSMGSFAEVYEIALRGTDGVSWHFPDGEKGPLPVSVSMKQKGGYLEEYRLRHELAELQPLMTKRPDQTEEEFANFREVATTGMKPDTLYRLSSPINNRAGRAAAADRCLKVHGIDRLINLYDTREEAEATEGYRNTYASTVETVYIHMGLDYTSERFKRVIADVITYIARNQGKYAVHCVLGEHRTGAVCMILSALMGASYDEIVSNDMLTYDSLYGVKPGTRQYELLADDNVNAVLQLLFGTDDPAGADLARLAEEFVLSTGISGETLAQAKAHLGE